MNARYRFLRVGALGVWYDFLRRVQSFAHVYTEGPAPEFLHGDQTPLLRDFGGLGDTPHICAGEPIIHLHCGVIVYDVRVQGACNYRYAARRAFAPFYSGDLLALHGDSKPDPDIWVPGNSVLAVCALALHPWAGSFRFASKITTSGSAQAFVRGNEIVVSEGGSGEGHHSIWIQKKYAPRLPEIVSASNRG